MILKCSFGGFALGKNHKPRRFAVQAVHDENPPPSVFALAANVIRKLVVQRTRFVALRSHREKARGFIRDQQPVVLVNDRE